MRRPLLALAIAVTALLAACSASTGPEWTYAPPTAPPAVTPAPSGDASAAPSEAPSTAPSDNAGGGGEGTVVDISALNIEFEQKEVSAPAGVPFVIHFDNKDAGIPHDIEIKDSMGMVVFKGDIVTGVTQVDYQVPALAAGTYPFVCTVHPNMTGTITAG